MCNSCQDEVCHHDKDCWRFWNHKALALSSEIVRLRLALSVLADAAVPIFTKDGLTTFEAHPATPALWDATGEARAILRGSTMEGD